MSICLECGLCCDGSLFGRAPLEPGDARRRLRVVGDGRAFEQPCAALDARGACTVYDDRPAACRRFVCRLHERAAPLEEKLAVVREVRALLVEVMAAGPGSPREEELRQRLEDEFARAHHITSEQ